MVKYAFLVILIAAAILSAQCAQGKAIDKRIYLIPAGDVDKKIMQGIKNSLPGLVPVAVRVEIYPQEAVPESAYDASRDQYLAGAVLNDIHNRLVLDTRIDNVLIVTEADLYAPDMNFVFGLADKAKSTGIISLKRLHNEFYGLKPGSKLLLDRAVKEAIHELGHIWGLGHCSNPKCAMYFSNSVEDTDKKKDAFCRTCKSALHRLNTKPLVNISLP